MSYKYKNIISAYNPFVKFHDDQYSDEDVKILSFPFDDLFSDFRIFNGLPIEEVDQYIGRIREIMIDVANRHAEISREEKLQNQKKGCPEHGASA